MTSRKKIAVFYVGGTPGMVPKDLNDAGSPLVPRIWDEFESELRTGLTRSLRVNAVDLNYFPLGKPIDSSHMNADKWVEIARAVKQKYVDYEGFIVIHGSDTMAYTASALSFIFENLNKNVVLTGANFPMVIDREETLNNMALAVDAIMMGGKPSVKIAFGNSVMNGCRATKASQFSYTVFETPKLPMGQSADHVATEPNAAFEQKGAFKLHACLNTDVLIMPCTPDFKGDFYRAGLATQPPAGVILQTFEAGNVPDDPSFRALIEDLNGLGIPTLAISQTFGGSVRFGKYDASSFLIENNVMNGADMTLEAALTKMMVVLGSYPRHRTKELMESNLRGELTPH